MTSITYKDLYNAIDQLRRENNEGQQRIVNSFEQFQEKQFTPLKEKVDQMWIWGTITIGTVSIVMNYIFPAIVKAIIGK